MPWNLPLHWLWRRALGRADLVTAAGPQLAARLQSHRRGGQPVRVLPMAADPGFTPRDRNQSRQRLGLPLQAPIVGYYGGWGPERGTGILLPAFRKVRRRQPDALLAVTGRPPAQVQGEPGVISLGYLPDAQIPDFVNALDVSAVVTTNSRFGRGSYPAKLCEAMACGVPVVATATEPVQWMLRGRPDMLVPVDDVDAFTTAVLAGLNSARVEYPDLPDWPSVAADLAQALQV